MKLNYKLLKGSIILLLCFNIFNAFNFVFQFLMARSLSVAEYGVLATLFSLVYLIGIFTESIQTVVTSYVAKEKDDGKIHYFLDIALRKASLFSVYFFVFYLVIALPLKYVLNIPYTLLALNGLTIFSSFLAPVTRGVLQGKKQFTHLGISMVVESVSKLVIAFGLVYVGWRVYGAVTGIIIGLGLSFIYSFFAVQSIRKIASKKVNYVGWREYARPAFFITFTIVLFYSMDILIARIVFSEEVAGAYSLASVLAKTIFLATHPISRAMFPISAENTKKKVNSNVLFSSLTMLGAILIFFLAIFYFFPHVLIYYFSGKNVLLATQSLFLIGIAISILSLANFFLLYNLSLGKTKGYPLLLLFILLEGVLLWHFSSTLLQFSVAFITSSIALLWGSIKLLR